ncbi:alpha/beta-hydrolase [Ceratobasidium sp. AG-I]|nr:alpha/beta-hydrolase [Ceratobasidium sp. AG-I]
MRLSATILLSISPLLSAAYHVRPFKIDLSSRVPHLKDLVERTHLPATSVLGSAGAGVNLAWLKNRQIEWLEKFDWEKEQNSLNKFNHSTVAISNQTIHFIHQRSSDPNAIPLILIHGWPGSFYEFNQVITPLSSPGPNSNVSFHVIVPSLPGFGFSSPAPAGWGNNDTATAFNTLLTDILGYKSYVAVAGDWGCDVVWALHNNHADHVKAVLYTGFIPQHGPLLDALLDDPRFANETAALSDQEKQRIQDNNIFLTDGSGYFLEQTTRPATIGLALYDNPIGQLAWISQLYLEASDPQFGVPPSTITNNTILTSASIYYLTRTFETAETIYYQNAGDFQASMRRAINQVPMGFASYKYELQYYPQFYVAEVGNLVFYSGNPFASIVNRLRLCFILIYQSTLEEVIFLLSTTLQHTSKIYEP